MSDSAPKPLFWVVLAFVLPSAGCATLQDAEYERTQWFRTEAAWVKFHKHNSEHATVDYKSGWKAGYRDVLMGGTGAPPMVPPHRYWKPRAILNDGDEGRQEWYAGYQDGASVAFTEPDTHYIKLWSPPVWPSGPACDASLPMDSDPNPGPALVPASERPVLTPISSIESRVEDDESLWRAYRQSTWEDLPPVPEP